VTSNDEFVQDYPASWLTGCGWRARVLQHAQNTF
jgi:hypothetical protein